MKTLAVVALCLLAVSSHATNLNAFSQVGLKANKHYKSLVKSQNSKLPNPQSQKTSQKQDCGEGEYSAMIGDMRTCMNCTAFCADECPMTTDNYFYCESCDSISFGMDMEWKTYFVEVPGAGGGFCLPCAQNCETECPDSIMYSEEDNSYCESCKEGYYLLDGECYECDSGCPDDCPMSQDEFGGSYCSYCEEGYVLTDVDADTGVGRCSPCDKGCVEDCPMSSESDHYCKTCDESHYLFTMPLSDVGNCMLCDPNCLDDCPMTSEEETYCTACEEGYFLAEGNCHKCSDGCATDCPMTAQSPEYCMECAEGFVDQNTMFAAETDEHPYKSCVPEICFESQRTAFEKCRVDTGMFGQFCPLLDAPAECCELYQTYIDSGCDMYEDMEFYPWDDEIPSSGCDGIEFESAQDILDLVTCKEPEPACGDTDDSKTLCEMFAAKGYCTDPASSEMVLSRCASVCDSMILCEHLASHGHCFDESTTEFMFENCASACGVCTQPDGTCAVDDHEGIVSLASSVGATLSGCEEALNIASCDDPEYGWAMQMYCPCTCSMYIM